MNSFVYYFFLNDTAPTEIYTLSLHAALPICTVFTAPPDVLHPGAGSRILEPILGRHSIVVLDEAPHLEQRRDRKSTRLNSSHANISYAVFCLKKKNTNSASICSPDARSPLPC